MFSIMAILVYIPTNNAQAFQFLYILSIICYFLVFFVFLLSDPLPSFPFSFSSYPPSLPSSLPSFLPSLISVAFLMDVRQYLIVVLICISFIISELSIFSCTYQPFVYLWRNVCSRPLPIFYSDWVFVLVFELQEFFVCSGCQSLTRQMIWKYFLPFSGLLFYYINCVF